MGKKITGYDFAGWATKYNTKCSDGRTILQDSFKHMDSIRVPLVWNHDHKSPENVLGHAILENRNTGVYAYGFFNENTVSNNAKELIKNKDITALSIYANKLQQNGNNVVHGVIREVSLVLAGANPGATIEETMVHNDGEREAVIYTDEIGLEGSNIKHAEEEPNNEPDNPGEGENEMPKNEEKTIQEVLDGMTEEQRNVTYALVGLASEEANTNNEDNPEEDETMKHNAFNGNELNEEQNVLKHAQLMDIINDSKNTGSGLRDAFIKHGINNLEVLLPDSRLVEQPYTITRDMGWVQSLINKVKKTPFSRIKTLAFDITEAEARAKGYIKGNQKLEEVFKALGRSTTPTTIYKLQKLDRDDVIDITEFDLVTYLKGEMKLMLDEELARAILLGDGRTDMAQDKINESHIRPILTDDDLYTIKHVVNVTDQDTENHIAKEFIRQTLKARKEYKGSGNPTLYASEDMITNMLLIEDLNGRRIYETITTLATALRVAEIVSVPVMEGLKTERDNDLMGIVVNMNDYVIGADKGGETNFFDDFDLNFNKLEYLIETRRSGALIRPKSAIVLELKVNEVVEAEG